MPDLIVRSRRVSTARGEKIAAIVITNGRISSITAPELAPPGVPVDDLGDKLVMPALFDSHVHVNEPGRTEWEGFETATRAAAAGGISGIADMPLNSTPVTTTLAAMQAKLAAAKGKLAVDCAFWGGVVPGNSAELEPMIEAGAAGFKAFLCHSGIDDFPNVTEADLRLAMPILAKRGVPLLAHAELIPSPIGGGGPEGAGGGDARRYSTYLVSRPKAWENAAIELLIKLSRETGCRVHIVHLSSAEAIPLIAAAKEEELPITAETCPHYLTFDSEAVPEGRTEYKCAPPIRESENREKLWAGLEDGTIDFIVSDHSPCTPALKLTGEGDFARAWGGISSLQFGLPAVWTQAEERGFDVDDLELWMCERPARFAGFGERKGKIALGYDADFVVWDPEASFTVELAGIHHRHKLTPYAGRALKGVVHRTYVRGKKAYDKGNFAAPPIGDILTPRYGRIHTAG